MTHMVQRLVLGLALLTCLGISRGLVCVAETAPVDTATKQVEKGAKQIGQGVEQTAKGVGHTVVEGARLTGEKLQEAGKEAQPQVENAWDKTKQGAKAAGISVKNFFHRLFGR